MILPVRLERRALLLGVAGVTEGDEEAALAAVGALALHDGLEGVDVRAADLVGLLDLHGEPVLREHAVRVRRLGADGEDPAVHAPCRRPAPCWGCRRGRSRPKTLPGIP